MAPFKLKFRMGSSRSTSQEVDADPQASQSLLQNQSTTQGLGASCSTLDSVDCTSLGSTTNDKRSLLPNGGTTNERLGYSNPGILQCSENLIPHSPPPSYEHVLEENRLAAANLENNPMNSPSSPEGCTTRMQRQPSQNVSVEEQISNMCMDPDCEITNDDSQEDERASHKQSLDSTEYLISTMTTPSSHDNLLECTGSCDPLCEGSSQEDILCDDQRHHQQHCGGHDGESCTDRQSADDEQNEQSFHQHYQNEQGCQLSDNEDNYSDTEWSTNDQYQQQTPQQAQAAKHLQPKPTSEIISNKSSKKIYKAVAKQWGITCKMSDQCRCMECQSHYFDCEFDDNDHQKTDGGLGAGTPMFISEVMHGTACTIL